MDVYFVHPEIYAQRYNCSELTAEQWQNVDLITCKSYEEVDANLSIGFADVFAQDSAEDNKVSTSVKPPVKEMKIVSGKPPSTPSSFKMFWPWSSSPAAVGSSKN
uniref:Uncharacterized protein n=1 Tax=Ditylenchus dipsaci TaxID=166011 RepID=A0A915D745_9BILA